MFFVHLTISPGMEPAKPLQVISPKKIKTTIRLKERSMARSALLFFCIVISQLTLPHPVQGNEQLRVGVYDNYPMQFVGDDGKVKGFIIDILEYISSREKWEISYVPGSPPPRQISFDQLYLHVLSYLLVAIYNPDIS